MVNSNKVTTVTIMQATIVTGAIISWVVITYIHRRIVNLSRAHIISVSIKFKVGSLMTIKKENHIRTCEAFPVSIHIFSTRQF